MTRNCTFFLIVISCLLCFVEASFSQEVAKLYSVEGLVEGRIAPELKWQAIPSNSIFKAGDAIRTGDGSRAAILGSDGLMVRLSSNALLEFKEPKQNEARELNLQSGDAYFLSRDPHAAPKVTTSIVSGSIRGTEFAVSVKPEQVTFSVLNGSVACSNNYGAVDLASGEEALTEKGKAPQKRIMVRPYDAVQWTLRYPSAISVSALAALVKDGKSDEQKIAKELLKAAQALESGQVEVAAKHHDIVTSLLASNQSASSNFLRETLKSQQAIIKIVQNDKEQAALLVKEVISSNPNSINGLFANSMLLQAKGDVGGALQSIEAGLKLEPYNSYLLARAAELNFGSGNSEVAEELANRSLQQNPNDSDSSTILGFIMLSRGKVAEATRYFETVISSSNNSYAHLGLGIAKFRSGEKEQARIEIQKAVHLDPQVSLYRSYLGKAFFENEQEGLANEELLIAAKLDPLDPTPHLYAAFNSLARFEPIAALGSLEDSIALNDNRAVYRSRLLLDKDQATRGSGIGRVFSALDFIQPAKIEALKSLSEDPTSYEAHFLLKDSLIGSEANSASVSEDVVATLLAPATFSSLLSTASGSATLNEYTSLFERPQGRNAFDIIGQSKDGLIETSEVHFAGGDDYSYLLRHGMVYANGYRDNDYDRSQSARFLGNYAVSPDDKILLEGIIVGRDSGDTAIGVSPHSNDPDQSFEYDDFTARLGFHHAWSESSQLISQTLFLNSRSQVRDLSENREFYLSIEQQDDLPQELLDSGVFDTHSSVRTKGVRADLQHLWNSEYFSLTSGAAVLGYTDYQDADSSTATDELGVFDSLDLSSQAENDVHAYRGYSYATIKPQDYLRIIGGLNYSNLANSARQSDPFVERESNQTKFSPKTGVILYPNSGLTLRGAYFETLGSSSARDLEGIEPVQVAGLQQLFDDAVGTEAKVSAVGADWKLPKSTYTGFTLMSRNLTDPTSLASDVVSIDVDNNVSGFVAEDRYEAHAQENSALAYVNQVLSDTFTATLNYDWTQSDDDFNDFQIRTHRTRIGINYFDPSGFFAFGSSTWRWQERENYDALDITVNENFAILSAGLGWQLPHRHGSVQLVVRNILDEDFSYQPIASDVRFYPGVDVSLSISLNF